MERRTSKDQSPADAVAASSPLGAYTYAAIGSLAALGAAAAAWFLYRRRRDASSSSAAAGVAGESALSPDAPVALVAGRKPVLVRLRSKRSETHNTRRLVFELASPQQSLGLPVGHHIAVHARPAGLPHDEDTVVRSYTPISPLNTRGQFELLIKVYPRGVLTQHLDAVPVGGTIAITGPHGSYIHAAVRTASRHIGLVCGGTGITPLYQVLLAEMEAAAAAAAGRPNSDSDSPASSAERLLPLSLDDGPELSFLSANVAEDDVLLRPELEAAARAHPLRCRVHFTIDALASASSASAAAAVVASSSSSSSWPYSVGRISPALLQAHLRPPAADHTVLVCGPPGFMKAVEGYLKSLGHAPERIITFGY
jgi:NAD(P)H-flavin reductase